MSKETAKILFTLFSYCLHPIFPLHTCTKSHVQSGKMGYEIVLKRI